MIEVNEKWFKQLAEIAKECENKVEKEDVVYPVCFHKLIGYASSASTFINLNKNK